MQKVVVYTKQELKKAYNDKADVIVVKGKLAKKIRRLMPLKRFAPMLYKVYGTKKITPAMCGAISVETGIAIALIILASSIGFVLIVSVFKDYKTKVNVSASDRGCEVYMEREGI